MNVKKYGCLTLLAALTLALGCAGVAHAEIIPPDPWGTQIGYPCVVLCETLTLREGPSASAKAIQTLPVGIAYPVWTGIGTVGTVLLGFFFLNEPLTLARVFFTGLLVFSIVGLKIT